MLNTLTKIFSFDENDIAQILNQNALKVILINVLIIFICCGSYASTIGLWRSATQAMYVAIKFPALIFLTIFCNSLINWFTSLVFGLNIEYKQSLIIIFLCFTIFSIILFSFIPVNLFVLYNTPSSQSIDKTLGVSVFTIVNVIFISIAGIISNIKLHKILLLQINKKLALKILLIWLAFNLFLGAQLSWNLRPFIGSPHLKVELIRSDAFKGNFYEDVYRKITNFIE